MPAGRFTPTTAAKPTSPFGTTPADIKLKPGQALHFKTGKGYYAGAPVHAVTHSGGTATHTSDTTGTGFLPYLTPKQIATQSKANAHAQITAAQAPLLTDQKQTAAEFAAQRAQTQGFDLAAMKALGGIGPQVQAGYDLAGKDEGSLAQGFSSSMQDKLTADQQAAADYAAAHGATGGNAPASVDSQAFGSALYMGNGFIPGQSLIAQGAHANQWATGTQAVAHAGAQQDILSTNVAAAKAKADTATEIARLAAKYPALFSAEEKALINQNIAIHKENLATYKAGLTANKNIVDANYKAGILAYYNHGQTTRDIVAANQAAYNNASLTERAAYHNATITVRGQANQIALRKALASGNQIDKGASMATGVIVLKDGTTPLGADGTPIPVDPRVYSSAAAKTGDKSVFGKMVKDARESSGRPIKNTSGFGGQYLMKPGLPIGPGDTASVGPGFPATTDDATRAQISDVKTFAEMVTALAAQYGTTKALARKALIKAGWKPDGTRPASTGGSGSATDPFAPGLALGSP